MFMSFCQNAGLHACQSHNLSSEYFFFRMFRNVKLKTYKTVILPVFKSLKPYISHERKKLIDDDRNQGYLVRRGNGRILQKTE
jgi:hypothetical protein